MLFAFQKNQSCSPVNDRRGNLLHLAVAALDAVEVVLDDAVAALAEVFAQDLLDPVVKTILVELVEPRA